MAISTAQVLVIDDDARHAASVRELLSAHGYRTDLMVDSERRADSVGAVRTDVLIAAFEGSEAVAADVLRTLRRRNPALQAIIVSDTSSCVSIAPLLRLGVCDFLVKPYEPEQLVQSVRDALARSDAERARDARDYQREAFLCALPDLIYLLDARGCFTFVGERLSDVLGFERESLLGRPWAELLDATLSESLRFRFDERRSGARATRGLDFEWHDPCGSLHVIELSATGLYSGERPKQAEFRGTCGLLRDVTAVRREAAELAASERRYHAFFEGAPVAMFVSRITDGRLIECNGAFRTLFGESVGGSDSIVFGDAAARHAFVEALPHHAHRTLQHHGRKLALHASPLSIDGTECLQATVADVTRDQQQLDERIMALAQQHRTQLRQLTGGVAHDFNELLARIIAFAEGLREAMTGVEQQRSGRLLHELFATTRRARDLISQLLLSVETTPRSAIPCSTDVGEIAIIDAEACIGQLLRESLQYAGFPARVFDDSEAALEYIASDPAAIALVLLDEPQTDARVARVALRIHALPDAPPVITMRGSGALLLGPATPDAAVAGTITKPFTTDALLDVVRTHARRTRHPTYAEVAQ